MKKYPEDAKNWVSMNSPDDRPSLLEVIESIEGLNTYASDLEFASKNGGVVYLHSKDLLQVASFLRGVASELKRIIPNKKIEIISKP